MSDMSCLFNFSSVTTFYLQVLQLAHILENRAVIYYDMTSPIKNEYICSLSYGFLSTLQ